MPDDGEDFPSLTLNGALSTDEMQPYPTYPVLFGRTNSGEDLTLANCRRSGLDVTYRPGGTTSRQEYVVCQIALRNSHITNPMDPLWTSAQCHFANLDTWTFERAVARPRESGTDDDGTIWRDIRIESPPALTVQLPEAKLSIHRGYSESFSLTGYRTTRQSELMYVPESHVSLDEIDEKFVTPMRYFLAFATDGRTPLERLTLSSESNRRSRHSSVDVIRPNSRAVGYSPDQSEMLLPLSSMSADIQSVIPNWYSLFADKRRALDLMFSVVFGQKMFLETRFLLLAQAAEVYHRTSFPDGVIDDQSHHERVEAVISGCPEPYREWLTGKLAYSNEPPLKRRLDELVDYSQLSRRGVYRKNFARLVTDTRNFHTHYDDELRKRAAHGESLYRLSEELRALLTGCFLRDLGFDDAASWDHFRNTRQGRWLTS